MELTPREEDKLLIFTAELPRRGDDVIGLADPTHLADGDKLKLQSGPLPQDSSRNDNFRVRRYIAKWLRT